MASSLEHLEDMCNMDESFEEVVKNLRKKTRTVIDDVIDLVRKAEDEGRELKQPKDVEYVIKPECEYKELKECVDSALSEVSDDSAVTEDDQGEYAKIKKALEDLLEEIKQIGDVFAKYEKGKGMLVRIECKTYATLLDILSYMDSLHYVERLDMVASALKEHLGLSGRLFLTCTFCEENMKDVYEAIKTENVEYSRSISLAMRVNTIQGLTHVWDMFEGGAAQNHLNKIAEALSEYVGSKITLTASLNVTNFKQALEEAAANSRDEGAKEEENEEEHAKEEAKSDDEEDSAAEESGQQAQSAQVAVPRRGVEIVAVKAGTRKTTLFDEIICEGERDEISEMGFDTRVGAQNRETLSTTDERVNDSELESGKEMTENESKLERQPSRDGPDTEKDGDTEANDERLPSRQVAEIPSEGNLDTVRGAVNNFYRDIVYMTSRTGESSSGSAVYTSTEETTASVTEVDSISHGHTSVTRQTERPIQLSVVELEKPGTRNIQDIDLSLRLSSALGAIGINQEVLNQRHERIRVSESIMNQMAMISKRQVVVCHFGSQAEGTTMIGLPSNLDTMVILENYRVLQNEDTLQQLSMCGNIILADDSRPGFMLLSLTDDMFEEIANECALISGIESPVGDQESSVEVQEVRCGFGAETVLALRMSAWPLEIKRSLQQRAIAWAFDASSEDLTNQLMTVVPYKSTAFRDDEMEWRISTAHVERVLMNSLNIHQRRVFILFRIILKYLVNPKMSKPLTSYMIKNIFFHMAAGTWPDIWNEASLVMCLNGCLNKTRQFLRANFLPNFFIQKENLIYNRLSLSDRSRADEIILHISNRPYASIASIQDGGVGALLDIQISRSIEHSRINIGDRVYTYLNLLRYDTCTQVVTYKDFLLEWIFERSTDETSAIENHFEILRFLTKYICGTENIKGSQVADTVRQYISTSLASHLVCLALKTENTIERDWYLCAATMYFHKGMESDALSSRMKFITALVAMNHLKSAREMLVDIEISDEIDSHAVCACRKTSGSDISFFLIKKPKKEQLMENVCSCVTFLPTESQLTPLALRYEMYMTAATAEQARPYNLQTLRCLKRASVDAKVYFGFLNTVLYSTIEDLEMYVGAADVHHKETLMNLIGLFSEFIGDLEKAAAYYAASVFHAPVHNVAQWYIALLLFKRWSRLTKAQTMVEL